VSIEKQFLGMEEKKHWIMSRKKRKRKLKSLLENK
jgi:hypothetical protein